MHRSRATPFFCVLMAASLFALAPAAGITLTFDDATCDDGQTCTDTSFIDPQYGDIPGVLDIVYDSDLDDPLGGQLTFWESSYGSLEAVAFGARIAGDQTAEIFLSSIGGQPVTLLGVDFGAWINRPRETQVTILDGDGNELFTSGRIAVEDVTHFDFDLTSDSGIRIRWGPTAYYVAIDNLQFETVPEPSVAILLAIGLSAIALSSATLRLCSSAALKL